MRHISLSVILLAIACTPVFSHAIELDMTSSTQYLWYQDFLANKNQNDVAEYLRLNATKLDKEGKISFSGYGRVTKQVTSSEDLQGRLYYFYLDYKDVIKDHLDVKAGRTFINSAAVSGTLDGIRLDVKGLGPFGITAFGGREVIFQDKREVGGGNAMSGVSAYVNTLFNTHFEVSFGNKYRSSTLAREGVGLDFSSTPIDMLNVYGQVKYDTISSEINDMLFGVKLVPIKQLTLKVEYLESRPTFDKNSVYRIFTVDRYHEISASAEYQIISNYRINFKYAKEFFGDDAEANVYDIGFLATPFKDFTLNTSYEIRNGYAGQLSGIRLNAGYDIQKAKLQAGIDYDDFRNDDSRAGTATKYWGGVGYQFNKLVGVTTRVEYDRNYINGDNYQGFAALNVKY